MRCLSILPIFFASFTAHAADFDQAVGNFSQKHCISCHGEEKQEGEFRIDSLSKAVGSEDTLLWAEVRERISSGEMPPEDVENPPTASEGAAVVEWLSARIKEGEAARMAKRDRVSFHRLSREEYVHTIYDLLGVHFDASDPGGLFDDPEWHGFERIGSVLSLSVSHVEKYFQATETILAEAYPDKVQEPIEVHLMANPEIPESHKSRLEALGLLEKVRYDLWPQDQYIRSRPGRLPSAGVYEVRVKLSGLKPANGRAPRLNFYHTDLDRVLFEQEVVAPENEPTIVSFKTHLPSGDQQIVVTNNVPGPSTLSRQGRHGNRPFISIKDGRIPWQLKLTDEEGEALHPFLILDWTEWRGPIVSDREQQLRDDYMPPKDGDIKQVREGLSRLARRAFRRPLLEAEIDKYVSIFESEVAAGSDFRSAVKASMLAILCSNSFLFIVEGSDNTDRQTLSDWELATRLSYFFWSTMPDEELFALAENGTLHEKEELRKQIARMLTDPKSKRFTESFPTQWLRLRKVGMFAPDKKLYPQYDRHLEQSMIGETIAFFSEVLNNNLSLREFLHSDWTMANSRLAKYYGIDGVTKDEFQRVSLKPEHHRGGLLTQAAILSLTSDGTRRRPVHRAVWLSEAIFGKSPPPPPANVDAIEPSPVDTPKATLRMRLEAHKSNPSCASCHQKFDPFGMAFENYDAIGRWRIDEKLQRGTGANPKLDPSGEFPDGRKFADADEFKQLLLSDLDEFSRAFIEKIATYGLRRAMTFEDDEALTEIVEASRDDNYQLRSILENFVTSDLFLKR